MKGKLCLLDFFEDVESREKDVEPVNIGYLDLPEASDMMSRRRLLHDTA